MFFLERIECRICGRRSARKVRGGSRSLASLLDQYSRAGYGDRLTLWLQYRDLREEFDDLDRMNEG